MSRSSSIVAALLCAICLVAAHPPARARVETIERVVAVVNDEAIFLSDLRHRAAPMLSQIVSTTPKDERSARIRALYDDLIEQLVDQELIAQAARRMQVTVSRDDVNRAIQNVRTQSELGEDEFWQAVEQQGFTEAEYRRDVRQQLLRLKVLNQRVRSRVNITEENVRERYEMKMRKARQALEFRASHVFLAVPDDATATEIKEIRERAEELRRGLTPESFEEATRTYGGGDLGWLSQGDLPDTLEDALLSLETGEISPVVRGSAGFHIFLLRERQRGKAELPSYEQYRERLYQEMVQEAMAQQEELFLEDLRRRAVIDVRL